MVATCAHLFAAARWRLVDTAQGSAARDAGDARRETWAGAWGARHGQREARVGCAARGGRRIQCYRVRRETQGCTARGGSVPSGRTDALIEHYRTSKRSGIDVFSRISLKGNFSNTTHASLVEQGHAMACFPFLMLMWEKFFSCHVKTGKLSCHKHQVYYCVFKTKCHSTTRASSLQQTLFQWQFGQLAAWE
jgi:hypothetical protein